MRIFPKEALYWHLADLLSMDVDVIFHDTTAIHFEVEREDERLRRRGPAPTLSTPPSQVGRAASCLLRRLPRYAVSVFQLHEIPRAHPGMAAPALAPGAPPMLNVGLRAEVQAREAQLAPV